MSAPADPGQTLARRLKALREHGLSGRTITQRQLADAFSTEEKASGPLISSWENGVSIPPANRIDAYATFFATEQSVARHPYRVLAISTLTPEEADHREALLAELNDLRESAIQFATTSTQSLWQFAPDQDVTIVCAERPAQTLANLPYTEVDNPDYVRSSRFSDLDALIELHGHIRAFNPGNTVRISTPVEVTSDMFATHLVVLGGVDWNRVTRDLLRFVEAPVRQVHRDLPADIGGFQTGEGANAQTFSPIVDEGKLVEDIAHFYRSPNPYNDKRTVTLCNGMFGRGVYGSVRALTDIKFRDRNEEYVRRRLNPERFSIVSRVIIASGEVVTPDWTRPRIRLHEWPKEPREHPDPRT